MADSMRKVQVGDQVFVTEGSHYGPKTQRLTTVTWVSKNGHHIEEAEGKSFQIPDVVVYKTVERLQAERRKLAVETDTELAELHDQDAQAERVVRNAMSRLHEIAGDRKDRRGSWGMTHRQAKDAAAQLVADGDARNLRVGLTPSKALHLWHDAVAARAVIQGQTYELDKVWSEHGWNRYFLVTNSNGHVHRGMNCHTCTPTTEYAWIVELADCDEDAMITEFGEKACTVCFPDAPANPAFHAPGRRDSEAIAARQAEKDDREAKKATKNLRPDEQFKGIHGRVTTVAGAKQALRDEREMCHYSGINLHHTWWPIAQDAAKAARAVLLGRGVTQAEIDKIIASAEKRQRSLVA